MAGGEEGEMTYKMRVQLAIARLRDGEPEADVREEHGLVVVREARAIIDEFQTRIQINTTARTCEDVWKREELTLAKALERIGLDAHLAGLAQS